MDPAVLVAIISWIVGPIIGYWVRRRELLEARDTNARLSNELAQVLPRMLEPGSYGIRIDSPSEYGDVEQGFPVAGTFSVLPEGQQIWTATFSIHVDEDGKLRKRYWPQARATIDISPRDKRWKSYVHNIGGHAKGEAKEFVVLVVGVEAQTLFKYFKKVGDETSR